ncbi:MAG: hypothetical protein J4400_00910 [Candidatus Aenigmarchaeota archaeon]|nr:hypothetical protein [Candidatus Aenigmarchaeota archaeon]
MSKRISLAEKLIDYAATHDDKITIAQAVKYTRCSGDRVLRALNILEAEGYVTRAPRKKDSYTLNWSNVIEDADKKEVGESTSSEVLGYAPPRIRLVELYSMTEEVVSLARQNYLSAKQKKRLDYLMGTLESEIDIAYPTLKSIFMPRRETTQTGRAIIVAPERWEEPLVQFLLRRYTSMMSETDAIFRHSDLNQDYVYSNIENPDMRRKIERRKMKENEYKKLSSLLKKAEKKILNSDTHISDVTALATRPDNQAIVAINRTRRLEHMPNALLAIESGFAATTVKKRRKMGINGQDVIDEKNLIDAERTSAGLIRRMRESGRVDRRYYRDFVELSRKTGVSGSDLVKYMEELDIDFSDMLPVMADLEHAVLYYSERNDVPEREAWQTAMKAYAENPNVETAADKLTGLSRFETTDDRMDIEERDSLTAQDMFKTSRLGLRFSNFDYTLRT